MSAKNNGKKNIENNGHQCFTKKALVIGTLRCTLITEIIFYKKLPNKPLFTTIPQNNGSSNVSHVPVLPFVRVTRRAAPEGAAGNSSAARSVALVMQRRKCH